MARQEPSVGSHLREQVQNPLAHGTAGTRLRGRLPVKPVAFLFGGGGTGMRVFIAGIMQGSYVGRDLHPQDYRGQVAAVIRGACQDVEIIDPWALHPGSVDYPPERARATLLEMARMAGESDVVVAYVPQASMGTALEIYEAFQRGRKIVTISPLQQNWVVQHLSDVVLPDLEAFEAWVRAGGLARLVNESF